MVVSLPGDATKAAARRVEGPRSERLRAEFAPTLPESQGCVQWPTWKGRACIPFRESTDRTHLQGDEDEDTYVVCICFFHIPATNPPVL